MGLIEVKEFAGSDLSFNDLFYKVNRLSNTPIQKSSEKIVMINSGSLSRDSFRSKLAAVISKVGDYKPKALGVDHDFSNDTSIYGSQELINALSLLSNKVILGRDSRKNKDDVMEFDSSKYGVVDFPEDEGQITVRRYSESANSFANQMRLVGSSLTTDRSEKPHLNRSVDGNSDFVINYIYHYDGNGLYDFKDNFFENANDVSDGLLLIEGKDLLETNKLDSTIVRNLLRNNYVIIGHMGPYNFVDKVHDNEDKYRVPCDTNLINRDRVMYGAVIHANALANLLMPDLRYANIEDGMIFKIFKELLLFVFLYYLLFLNLGKMGTIAILALGSLGLIYLTLLLMKKGVYLEIGSSLLQLLVLEEAFESIEPLLHKFYNRFNLKKGFLIFTILGFFSITTANGQSIQLAVKKGSLIHNDITYKQGANLNLPLSSVIRITPNSVVLAKNDKNKVIQLPSGIGSGKSYKTLFKTGSSYNESVLNVMFNKITHPIHQAGITTRGGTNLLRFCPADSAIIIVDTLPFFINTSTEMPKSKIVITSIERPDTLICDNNGYLVVSQNLLAGVYNWSTTLLIGGAKVSVNNVFYISSSDEKLKLQTKRSLFQKSIDSFTVEAIEILMEDFDVQEHIKLIDEVDLDNN
jgi:CHASE2 domain-containing sensor protein